MALLWFLILPFQIVMALLAITVGGLTWAAPRWGWRRGRVFGISTVVGLVLFIPTCYITVPVVNAVRFGDFHYDQAHDVRDTKITRYLPPGAHDIAVIKGVNSHFAVYRVARDELEQHLDSLWSGPVVESIVPRDTGEARIVNLSGFPSDDVLGFGWSSQARMLCFNSPFAPNGAGCFYYLDPESDRVFHRAGYW